MTLWIALSQESFSMDEEGILENSGLLPSISFVRRLCRIEQAKKKTPLVQLRVPLSIARLF